MRSRTLSNGLDLRYKKFPIKDLERISGIAIPKNKRNYRKQALHLRMARSNLEILSEDAGHALQGRPKGSGEKRELIRSYAREHPDANHSDIAKALGVSRSTVIKWLRAGGATPTVYRTVHGTKTGTFTSI